ncbi:hypothetical protein CEXT_684651, partial [Caerostris extrusa]
QITTASDLRGDRIGLSGVAAGLQGRHGQNSQTGQ